MSLVVRSGGPLSWRWRSPTGLWFPPLWGPLVLGILWSLGLAAAFSCHAQCACIWRGGKQTAECTNLRKIPSGLDSGIQVLNVRQNPLGYLGQHAFLEVGLVNLQKLYASGCGIEQIDELAFFRLTNLIELDLSDNRLTLVPAVSLRQLPNLRMLILRGNDGITHLGSSPFSTLTSLTTLDLGDCRLDVIGPEAFAGLDKLEVLKLDGNLLDGLSNRALLPLRSLHGAALESNPWRCDCRLRAAVTLLKTRKVTNFVDPTCHEPPKVKGRRWSQLSTPQFACAPSFLNSSSAFSIYEGNNVTLECRTGGDPPPKLLWYWRDRVLSNLSEGIESRQVFLVRERDNYSSLTITAVQEPNAGSYSCRAENLAGVLSKNYTVHVSRKPFTRPEVTHENTQEVREPSPSSTSENNDKDGGGSGKSDGYIGVVAGVASGALLVLLLLLISVLAVRRRRLKRSASEGGEDGMSRATSEQSAAEESRKVYHQEMDPLMVDSGPNVWVVKDHLRGWNEAPMTLPPPPRYLQAPGHPVKGLLMEQDELLEEEDEDIQSRLHSELSETLRGRSNPQQQQQQQQQATQRERGDGCSELDSTACFETLRVRDLPHHAPVDNKYVEEHPSAYFRPEAFDGVLQQQDTGSDGTEV